MVSTKVLPLHEPIILYRVIIFVTRFPRQDKLLSGMLRYQLAVMDSTIVPDVEMKTISTFFSFIEQSPTPVATGITEYENRDQASFTLWVMAAAGSGVRDSGRGCGGVSPRKTLGLVEAAFGYCLWRPRGGASRSYQRRVGGKEKAGFSEGRWGELTTDG